MRMYFKNGEYKDLYNTDDDHLLQNLEEIIQEHLGDDVVKMLHDLIDSISKEVQDDLYYIREPLYELSALCDYVKKEIEVSKKLSRQTLLNQIHDIRLLGSKATDISSDTIARFKERI